MERYCQGETEVLGDEPVPLPFCPAANSTQTCLGLNPGLYGAEHSE